MKKNLMLLICILMVVNVGCKTQEKKAGGYQVGEYNLFVLTESQGVGNTDLFINVTDSILALYAPDGTFQNALNAILIKKGDEVWLADTGFGRNIFAQMDSLGIQPDQVNHIILTHMHPDHISGMLRDGKSAFPNADVRVSEMEYQYWNSEEEMMKMPEERRDNFLLAQQVIREYGDRIKTENPYPVGSDLGDGIHMLEAYGHTPGHVAYLISDGGDKFLIWGDLTHAVAMQTAHPEISIAFDYDPDKSRESRTKVLEYVSSHSIPVAGMHVPWGGVGKVNRDANGYFFITTAVI